MCTGILHIEVDPKYDIFRKWRLNAMLQKRDVGYTSITEADLDVFGTKHWELLNTKKKWNFITMS